MKTIFGMNAPCARKALSIGVLAISSSFIGCAADVQGGSTEHEGTTSVESMKQFLVAEAKMPGYTVSFYEPELGLLLEFETGEADARLEEPPGLDSVQRYEYLTGEKAPLALVEAMKSAGGDGHEHDPVPERLETEEGTVDRLNIEGGAPILVRDKGVGRSTPEWFWDNFCQKTDRYWGTPAGYVYRNDNSSWRDGVEYLRGGVYVLRGQLNYRQGYSGGNIPDQWYTLTSGMYAAWRNTSRIDRTASSAVQYATGVDNGANNVYGTTDEYSHCLNYHY